MYVRASDHKKIEVLFCQVLTDVIDMCHIPVCFQESWVAVDTATITAPIYIAAGQHLSLLTPNTHEHSVCPSVCVLNRERGVAASRHLCHQLVSPEKKRIGHVEIQLPDHPSSEKSLGAHIYIRWLPGSAEIA